METGRSENTPIQLYSQNNADRIDIPDLDKWAEVLYLV
jgi:hypothetical protein